MTMHGSQPPSLLRLRRTRLLRGLALLLLALYGGMASSLELHHNHEACCTAGSHGADLARKGDPCPVLLFSGAHGDLDASAPEFHADAGFMPPCPSGTEAPCLADWRLPRRRGPPHPV
jgi:hypothetical protein